MGVVTCFWTSSSWQSFGHLLLLQVKRSRDEALFTFVIFRNPISYFFRGGGSRDECVSREFVDPRPRKGQGGVGCLGGRVVVVILLTDTSEIRSERMVTALDLIA